MVELDQMKLDIQAYEEPLKEVGDSLDLENKRKRIEELEREMEAPGFWDDPDRANAKMKDLKSLKGTVDGFCALKQQYEDNKAEREAKREAHFDELADKANELNAKLAEADKAAGEKIKEMAAEHEAFDKAMDEAVADANAAFVSETKDIMGE